MEILAVSCIHNDVENILKLLDKASKLSFDVVVCPGDFTDANIPKDFTRMDITKLILSELKTLGKPIVAVPGSWDGEVIDFLEKEDVSVHGRGMIINNVGFYGFGGARTPFGTPFEPVDNDILKGLERGYASVKEAELKVQVTHMPPVNTRIDMIFSGAHVGSEGIRWFIEKNQPDVAISSHIHEARGVDFIGKSKLVNSGRFPEGHCALIKVEKTGSEAKIISLT